MEIMVQTLEKEHILVIFNLFQFLINLYSNLNLALKAQQNFVIAKRYMLFNYLTYICITLTDFQHFPRYFENA
jgi:hypothetical protein